MIFNQLRKNIYLDSVALMRISKQLTEHPEIVDAVIMIGTDSNKALLGQAGLLGEDLALDAGANDLIVAIEHHQGLATDALSELVDQALHAPSEGRALPAWQPRTLDAARAVLPNANLALISTPGEFAAREARLALTRDLNVLLFSDNVSIEDEINLKREALRRDLLFMGPDCGTAYLSGQPLAFANVVLPGRIGIIAASGTGLQQVAVLLARLGYGISHGIGVGGRDLSDAVGGLSTFRALELLEQDPGTDKILLISKPPGESVAKKLFERLAGSAKPCTACVFGLDEQSAWGVPCVSTLKEAAEHLTGSKVTSTAFDAHALCRAAVESIGPRRRSVAGLYCGGTLCLEAERVLNKLGIDTNARGSPHRLLDLGADEFTLGKPHPMLDPEVRSAHIEIALRDPHTAVVLLDVILGYGAHRDPATMVADCMSRVTGERPVVVASICGTRGDPQDMDGQIAILRRAGVLLAPSNADAADLAGRIALAVCSREH